MKNKRPLVPGFLNRLDQYLLLNKPDTWSARTHLVLYYGLLFIFVLTIICFFVPGDARENSTIYVWGFFTGVLAAIGFIIWLIYLLHFNVFKRFGIVEKGDKVKTFLLYFISVGIMVVAIYVPSIIETIKANMAYGDEEIVKDINDINLSVYRLEKGSLPVKWRSDTCLVRNINHGDVKIDGDLARADTSNYDDEGRRVYANHTSLFYIIDTVELNRRKMDTDSVTRMNDSMYVFYECPIYDLVRSYRTSTYAGIHQLSAANLYRQVFYNALPVDKIKLQAQVQLLQKKYLAGPFIPEENYNSADDTHDAYASRLTKKYGLSGMNNSISNITERKYRWEGFALPIFIRLFWYSTLTLSLLVFIFRQSTVKTFFLTLLTAVILTILVSLFLGLSHTTATGVFVCFLILFIVFAVTSAGVFYSKIRNAVHGIALNLTVFLTALVPLLLTALYYQVLRDYDDRKHNRMFNMHTYDNEERNYMYAEIIGTVLLLIFIETVYKKLYRKWYALPEA